MGGGVQVAGIRRVVDQFLQQASLSASSDAGAAAALSEVLDRAQALFGDPSAETGYFNRLDKAFQAFSAAGIDPASRISRNQALTSLTDFLNQSSGIAGNLRALRVEADSQIQNKVGEINQLLVQIDDLNASITRAKVNGHDASGAQNAQAQLIDQAVGPDRHHASGRAGRAHHRARPARRAAGLPVRAGEARPTRPTAPRPAGSPPRSRAPARST